MTKKGSFISKTDVGLTDRDYLYSFTDRFILVKDIIIRGGENVVRNCQNDGGSMIYSRPMQDSVSVENALYADPRILEAAAVGVPDERLGELVAAVVSVKPPFQGRVTEAALIALARKRYDSLGIHTWVNLNA